VSQPEIHQNTKNPYFGSSALLKVIDVDIPEKLVTSDCYHKQEV